MLKNFLADELAFPIAIGGEDHLIAALEGIGDRPRSFRAMSCFITDQVGRPLITSPKRKGTPAVSAGGSPHARSAPQDALYSDP